MDRWRYLTTIRTFGDLEDADGLSRWGHEGWELVGIERLGELSDTRLEWLPVFRQRQPQ